MHDTSIPESEYWLNFAARLLALQDGLDSNSTVYKEIDNRVMYCLAAAQESVSKFIESTRDL